jgi:biopolymer transport protein ExbD
VQQLQGDLLAVKARDAKASVVIQGNAQAQYAGVIELIDLCNEVGISLSLATARIGY